MASDEPQTTQRKRRPALIAVGLLFPGLGQWFRGAVGDAILALLGVLVPLGMATAMANQEMWAGGAFRRGDKATLLEPLFWQSLDLLPRVTQEMGLLLFIALATHIAAAFAAGAPRRTSA